jgi:hypothetical protein
MYTQYTSMSVNAEMLDILWDAALY